jgi:hypothetical protein
MIGLWRVQNDELHFKQLDIATAREDFLEKEMLDSDVHHLEVRGTFFDKLSILAAGSLAVGISFIVAGMEHPEVRAEIQQRIVYIVVAFSLLFTSLALCIWHNYLISRAVHLLSSQLQNLYKGSNLIRVWIRDHPNAGVSSFEHHGEIGQRQKKKVVEFDEAARSFEIRRNRITNIAHWVGHCAMPALLIGYAIGLGSALAIYMTNPEAPPAVRHQTLLRLPTADAVSFSAPPSFLSNQWYSNPEWWLCVLGFPTLFFVGYQSIANARAAKAALLNAQAVITAERAWVMADLSYSGEYPQVLEGEGTFYGGPILKTTEVSNIKLTCRNQGRSPAWIDMVRAQVDIVDSKSVSMSPVLREGNRGPMGPIGAGGEISRSLELRCEGHREQNEFLSIYVLIEYRDIYGEKHETHLGYSVSGKSLMRQNARPERNRNT